MTKNFAVYSLISVLLIISCASVPNSEDIKKAETLNKIGYSYLDNGQVNEAFIEFQKALALNPHNKEALYNLGYISSIFKKFPEAISYYKRALSIDPAYSEAINNLGVLYSETGNWDEAIKYFKAALDNAVYLTPAWAYSNLSYAYYKKGDYLNAENAVKDALLRNPVSPKAVYILGLIYLETHNDEAAIEEFKKAIGMLPDYTDAHWELGKAYFKTGKKARALKHFELVVEKDNNIERKREALNYIEQLKY
ncbi:MAG: tetratricopeptide repeat protein [Nitrospirae bacterium]|nr:tetratricopeptide repeat protein [Nitrospirota bacterium]